MITSLVTAILIAAWFMILAVGTWILTRMNSQVRRLKDSPTPKEAYNVLADQHEATDLRLLGVQRLCTANEQQLDDLLVRIKSIQARTNQTARKEAGVDLEKLADYIQSTTEEAPEAASTNFDQATQQEIDYR